MFVIFSSSFCSLNYTYFPSIISYIVCNPILMSVHACVWNMFLLISHLEAEDLAIGVPSAEQGKKTGGLYS